MFVGESFRSLLGDPHESANLCLTIDDGDCSGVAADAAVGGVAAVDVSFMHADAGVGESHPVGHGGAKELASRRRGVLTRVGISVNGVAIGVEDLPVKVRAFVLNFFSNVEVSRGCFMLRAAGRNAVVHGEVITDEEEAALGREVNQDTGV